ncbi:MAG: hypothetical protein NC350_02580 [Corallococcus sp.]|nr:hypothetical protein [Corallococcus sp.]
MKNKNNQPKPTVLETFEKSVITTGGVDEKKYEGVKSILKTVGITATAIGTLLLVAGIVIIITLSALGWIAAALGIVSTYFGISALNTLAQLNAKVAQVAEQYANDESIYADGSTDNGVQQK